MPTRLRRLGVLVAATLPAFFMIPPANATINPYVTCALHYVDSHDGVTGYCTNSYVKYVGQVKIEIQCQTWTGAKYWFDTGWQDIPPQTTIDLPTYRCGDSGVLGKRYSSRAKAFG